MMNSLCIAKGLTLLSLLALFALPLGALAQNSGEVARLSAELATLQKTRSDLLAELEKMKQQQGERAIQSSRLAGSKPVRSSQHKSEETLKQELAQEREVQTALRELSAVSSTQRDKVRGAFIQLRAYGEEFRKVDKVNRVKNALSLGMSIAQEVQAFATTGGKVVEIATWSADKLSGEIMKRTLDGSSDYYQKTIVGISGAAASVSPEMERLAQLSGLSLEGWRAYLNKYEDMDLESSGGQIMAKGRVLLDHLTRAEDSLIKLHRTLDVAARESQTEIQRTEENIEALNKALAEAGEKPEALESSKKDDPANALHLQLRELDAKESELRTLLARAMQDFSRFQEAEQMASVYFSMRSAFANDLGRFAAKVTSTLDLLSGALARVDRAVAEEKERENEYQKFLEAHAGTATYPSDQVNDPTAIANTAKQEQEFIQLHHQQIDARKSAIGDLKTAYEETLSEWNSPPYDESSYKLRAEAVETAFQTAQQRIAMELKTTRELTGVRHEQLAKLLKSLFESHNQGFRSSPFGTAIDFRGGQEFSMVDTPQTILYSGLSVVSNMRQRLEQQTVYEERNLAYDEAALPGKLEAARRQSADERQGFLRAAASCKDQGDWMLNGMGDYLAAMGRYHTALGQLVSRGVLVRDTGGQGLHYRLNAQWIKETLGDERADCRGVRRIFKALGSDESHVTQLRQRADSATQRASFGTLSCPVSRWSELNEATTHNELVSKMRAVGKALEESNERFARLPPGDPVSGLLQRLPNDNFTLMDGFPAILSGMQTSHREIDALLRIAKDEMTRAAEMQRADAPWLADIKKYPERIEKNIKEQLGCLDPGHILIAGFDERIEALKKLSGSLSRVGTYLNATQLIDELEQILESARNLGISEEKYYLNAVRDLTNRNDKARTSFTHNEASYSPVDIAEIRKLLFSIGESLDNHRSQLTQAQSKPSNEQVQLLYQSFIDAYGNGNLPALLRLLAPEWTGGDGSDIRDVEDYLTNAFKMFDRIEYRISGFSASPRDNGKVQVSYSVSIIGENHRQKLKHEENSKIIEEIGLREGKAVILRTLSGKQWLN